MVNFKINLHRNISNKLSLYIYFNLKQLSFLDYNAIVFGTCEVSDSASLLDPQSVNPNSWAYSYTKVLFRGIYRESHKKKVKKCAQDNFTHLDKNNNFNFLNNILKTLDNIILI